MNKENFVEKGEGWNQDILPGYEHLAPRTRNLNLDVSETKRPISPGAERHLGEVFPVLDHGFVYLVDYMGNDQSVEQAARVSYGKGTRKVNETRGLIRYLMRHAHTTPFEMVEFKFHAKMPIFVARQWVRHRTASINEYSARYSVLDNEFYVPEPEAIAVQSKSNKQGRGEIVDAETAEKVRKILIDDAMRNYGDYEELLDLNIAKELARINLDLNFYTQWYWKVNLHNGLHFEWLRKDPHAQLEIRKYADVMGQIIDDSVPVTWEAFSDYQLEAVRLSKGEKEMLVELINADGGYFADEIIQRAKKFGIGGEIGKDGKPKGELAETIDKFAKMGIIIEK